jgi:hypothetical protein
MNTIKLLTAGHHWLIANIIAELRTALRKSIAKAVSCIKLLI